MKRWKGFTLNELLVVIAVIAVLGLGLLFLREVWRQGTPPLLTLNRPSAVFMPPRRPATPFEAALRPAREWRSRAMLEADREREARAARDPGAANDDDLQVRRQEWEVVSQRSLRRARLAALQALLLARSPEEKYAARLVLARLEHYLGHSQAELQIARQLMKQKPADVRSHEALNRALNSSGFPVRHE
jgi:prepilin-type N-terminal cleavage/methylation domain-containing protein